MSSATIIRQSCKGSFLESLAEDQHERAIGVILSGTATDGTVGLEAIKAEGGITFAQDDSARHDSMPRSAVAAGCVDFVLSPEYIAREIARIEKHPYTARKSLDGASPEDERALATADEDEESRHHPAVMGLRAPALRARALKLTRQAASRETTASKKS
jgi:CheB methylesterase